MNIYYFILIIIATIILFTVLHKIGKNKKPFRKALLSVLSGLLSLIVVDLVGCYTGVYIPISLLSVLTSAIGGIPGVTTLLSINLIF